MNNIVYRKFNTTSVFFFSVAIKHTLFLDRFLIRCDTSYTRDSIQCITRNSQYSTWFLATTVSYRLMFYNILFGIVSIRGKYSILRLFEFKAIIIVLALHVYIVIRNKATVKITSTYFKWIFFFFFLSAFKWI